MGNRGNIIVKNGDEQVCLYTHWKATELPETLRMALNIKARWDDAPYLTRIIFCEMVPINEWNQETGYGISQTIIDGGDKVITVDVKNQNIKINSKDPVSFNEFCQNDIGW